VNFWVSSADEVARNAGERGGSVIVAPHKAAGFRNAVLADPYGATFSVSQLLATP
jgi:predicted enzyme related to lactoylglutathione lyase